MRKEQDKDKEKDGCHLCIQRAEDNNQDTAAIFRKRSTAHNKRKFRLDKKAASHYEGEIRKQHIQQAF